MEFEPYDGEVIPLENSSSSGGFEPYDGEVLPLEPEVPELRKTQVDENGVEYQYDEDVPTGTGGERTFVRTYKDPADGEFKTKQSMAANAKNNLERNSILKSSGEDLLKPGSQLYEGLDESQAQQLYKMYKEDPNSEMTLSGLSYKGTLVPTPRPKSIVDDVPVIGAINRGVNRVGDAAASATAQMAQDLAVNTAAVADETVQLFGGKTEMAKTLDEWLANYNPQGLIDNAVSEGTKGAIAVTIASKLGKPTKDRRWMKDTTVQDKIPVTRGEIAGKAALTGVKGEAIFAAGSNESSEIGFGKTINGLISPGVEYMASKLSIDPKDRDTEDFSSQRLSTAAGIFTEGLVASGVMEGVMKGALAGGKFAKKTVVDPIMVFFSKEALEKKIIRDMFDDVMALPPNPTPEQKKEAFERFVKYASDPKSQKVIIDFGIEQIKKLEVDDTTMQAIAKSAAEAGDDETAGRALAVESGILKLDGVTDSRKVIDSPSAAFDKGLRDVEEYYGGDAGREGAKKTLVDRAETLTSEADQRVIDTRTQLEMEMDDFSKITESDPKIGKIINDVRTENTFNPKAYSQRKAEEIGETIRTVEDKLSKQEDAKYDSFIKASANLNLNPEFKELFEQAKEYLPTKVRDFNSNKYSEAYRNLKPAVDRRLRLLAGQTDPKVQDEIESLLALRENLTNTQIDYFLKSGGSKKVEAARLGEEARTFSRDVYQSYFSQRGSNPLAMYRRQADKTFDVEGKYPEAGKMSKAELQTKSVSIVDQIFNDKGRFYAGPVRELLAMEGKEDLAVGFMLGSTAEKLLPKMIDGTFDKVEMNNLFTALRNNTAGMKPEEQAQIKTFMDLMMSKKGNIQEMTKVLEEYSTKAAAVRENVKGKVLKDFFVSVADKNADFNSVYRPSEKGGTQILSDVINSPDPEGTIRSIMEFAKDTDNPELVMDGLKSAWYRNFRNKLLNRKQMNNNVATNIIEGNESLVSVGKMIAGEDDPAFNATLRIAQEVAGDRFSRLDLISKGQQYNPNSIKTGAQVATNRVVTFLFGVLNPVSQKIRTGTSAVLDNMNPKEAYVMLADQINVDKELFNAIVTKVMEDEKFLFTPTMAEAARKFLSKSVILSQNSDEDLRMSILESQEREKGALGSVNKEVETLLGEGAE